MKLNLSITDQEKSDLQDKAIEKIMWTVEYVYYLILKDIGALPEDFEQWLQPKQSEWLMMHKRNLI